MKAVESKKRRTDVELVGVAAQGVVKLLNEIPANLVLPDVACLLGGRLVALALLEINITVCRHGCLLCCGVELLLETLRNRERLRCSKCAARQSIRKKRVEARGIAA